MGEIWGVIAWWMLDHPILSAGIQIGIACRFSELIHWLRGPAA